RHLAVDQVGTPTRPSGHVKAAGAESLSADLVCKDKFSVGTPAASRSRPAASRRPPELYRVTSRGGSRCSCAGRPGSPIRRTTQCAARDPMPELSGLTEVN